MGTDPRRERRRALAREVRRVMRSEDVSDEDLVQALEDALVGFRDDEE
jgi:hypothetical protein